MDMRVCTGSSAVNSKLRLCVYSCLCVCVRDRAHVRAYISIFQSFQFRVLSQQQVNYYRQQSTQGLPSCRIRISYLCVHAVCVCVCLWVWI